ncbi:Fur family transcriptional regulator [Sphaerisporangium perillae]|uniref:Fur family transcriptional regulator n=1 Tax=Sphaerisporangium perillae TaxID=2935860 RepID=UPI00200DC1CE|nr:Fur family transcriptional regulator [Sphaerisporangium perillae]
MTSALDETTAQLRAAGLSPTRRRRLVLEALDRRPRPVGAHELYVELTQQGTPVGMSTVYRTLTALAAKGLLHVFVRDGETHYRLCAAGRHYHLVCRRCGLVVEHVDEDEGWLKRIAREADFEADSPETEIHGVCGPCHRALKS